MAIAMLANVLAIHDKLVRIFQKEVPDVATVATGIFLQGSGGESLHLSDVELDAFLEKQVLPKFGVQVQRRHIRATLNGTHPTVGDLSIAISSAIQRQHRPRRDLARETFR